MYRSTKYFNKKVKIGNKIFDSQKEGFRYNELKMLEDHGKIFDLQCQVKYELQPSFTNERTGKTERAITYKADFVYRDDKGVMHIEDVKGYKTQEYQMKRKMMAYKGYYIEEV